MIDRFRNAPGPTRILVLLVVVHVVIGLALACVASGVGLDGDQVAYRDGAMALSNLVRDLAGGGPVHLTELQRNLVGGGWFTPGSSIALAPLYVVDPHASTFAVHAYLATFSTALLLFAVARVRRVLGDLHAIVLMVLPGLIPTWLLFSLAAWGDLIAGLLATILLVELVTLLRSVVTGRAPRPVDGIRLGVAAVATVYARSSTSLLVLGTGAVVGLTALVVLRGRLRGRTLLGLAAAAVTFAAMLAPWSVFASSTLKSPVLTTTTVPVVMSVTFGDRGRMCFGPCDPVHDPGTTTGTTWFPPMQYSREVQRATGRSEVEVEKQMWAYTRPSVSPHSYTKDVIADFGRYAGEPASFARWLMPGGTGGAVYWPVVVLTYVGWIPLLLGALALILRNVRATVDQQVVGLLTAMALTTLFGQPFVHMGSGRYWTTAAPLAAIALGLVLQAFDARRPVPRLAAAPWVADGAVAEVAPGVRTWLTWAQRVLAGLVAATVVVVLVLGLA